MTMNSFEDHRGIFGPDERVQMQRNAGIRIEIPEPDITTFNFDGAVPPPVDLDGALAFYPGEEPQNNVRSIAGTMQQIHDLSERITHIDAIRDPMEVQSMAKTRADLTRHLPDVF